MVGYLRSSAAAAVVVAAAGCSSQDEPSEPIGPEASAALDAGLDSPTLAPDARVDAPPGRMEAGFSIDAGPDGQAPRDATMDAGGSEGDASPPDPCQGGPALPDASGPMKIVLYGEGFAGLPFSVSGVYENVTGVSDICGTSMVDAEAPVLFDVVRSNELGARVHVRWSNSPSNTEAFPPVRDDYTERDYMIFEFETMVRRNSEIVNLKFGAGGGGDAGLYAGSRLEGEVGADLEETGRIDAHFRLYEMAYTAEAADGGTATETTSELLCAWVVGNCRLPLD